MAGTAFEVNTSTLKNDLSTIDSEISVLKKDVQQLRTTAQQLSTMWEGNAKASFLSAVNTDIGYLDDLIGAIEKYNHKADTSRIEYEKCESSVAGIIDSIRV